MTAIRPYRTADRPAVLTLIDMDRITGQPTCRADVLDDEIAGQPDIDQQWWSELTDLRSDVLEQAGVVAGAVSYAFRPRDRAGVVLWLHGREDPGTVESLLAHALGRLAGCARRVEAYTFTGPGRAHEGIPIRRRSATDRAMIEVGFTSQVIGHYRRASLPPPQPGPATESTYGRESMHSWHLRISTVSQPAGWRLELLHDEQTVIGEAIVGPPVDEVAELRWIAVQPDRRAQGAGRWLLGQALRFMTIQGATGMLLFVDDDDPGGQRDRTAATRLYEAAGLPVIDEVRVYERGGG